MKSKESKIGASPAVEMRLSSEDMSLLYTKHFASSAGPRTSNGEVSHSLVSHVLVWSQRRLTNVARLSHV